MHRDYGASYVPPEVEASMENEIREKYFQAALAEVTEKHPDLKQDILRSLETPQLGEHHNEGEKMDAHLSLILATLEAIKNGQYPEDVDEQTRKLLTETTVANDAVLVDYTFMHDISKPDCLTLKVEGEKDGIEISWEQWQQIEQQGSPFRYKSSNGTEVPITSISYYHLSEGATGQHGTKAAKMLEGKNIPPEILIAINKHEVAYQFKKINADTYEEHMVRPGYSETQQDFIMVAGYVDAMASLRSDGQADLADFNNLVKSRENHILIRDYLQQTGAKIRANQLTDLKKQDGVLTLADLENITPKEKKYDPDVLSKELDLAIGKGDFTSADKEVIISSAGDLRELGKKFGPKMTILKGMLQRSEVK